MPRVGYTVPQQGFRPFTNPKGALAGLPGIGVRGLGLGSLGAVVPDQSVVIYQGKWQTTYTTWNPMDVVHAVESALVGDGLVVRNEAVNAPTAAKIGLANIPFSVTLTIQVNNGLGFADPNDIIADINHEVYVATGYMPLAGSITSVAAPGGGPTPTGQPSVTTAPNSLDPNCVAGMPYDVNGNPCAAAAGSVQDWGTWIQNNLWWIAAGAVAVVVVPKIL
jgi:hypothetical protein